MNETLRNFQARLLPTTFLLIIAMQENVPAQASHFSDAFLSDVKITQSGKPVAVRSADPFARPDQERTLLKFLNEPYTYQWDSQTTVSDIGRDVGKQIALQVDHRALEEIGLTADSLVFPESDKKKRPAEATSENPFADHPPPSPATLLTSQSSEPRWWDKKITTTPAKQMTNAAVLFHGLSNAELVIATWSGRWLITTEQAAEENLSTRLYDVTPIAGIQDSRPAHVFRGQMDSQSSGFGGAIMSSDHTLSDVVQTTVDPERWEMLGGPSTCRTVVINNRTWLVTSAPVMTHWKVQALLNQLNGS